ncbi:MAG: hypothetical protein HY912_21525 [Desulfomonile tiedjei]|uniref:Uncharacterized protein n=1 Tax=Desulfomonile tiedjei TaxID=2358 RepID=A0A9D6V714_9BACT|nr:hypothetical protein [Desulfomonile tiedjei]
MNFAQHMKLVAFFGAISAVVLLLLWQFVPGFSVVGLSGWLIYLIGGVLVFLAYLRRHSSGKTHVSEGVHVQKAEQSDHNVSIEEVRSRVRSVKLLRRRSSQDDRS